ncbi:MAG: DUF5107 domain-containing protein, partial [bacterium]|nr:DUF5107 domain-containing protein [bacterium]
MASYEARIWEETLTIPTYRAGRPERNPMFYAGRGYQGARGPMYPYALLDARDCTPDADTPRDQAWRAIRLENRYLRLCVLPEIGGRLFEAVDKTNDYDFFYRQHVIKPALIGMVGAWISGGVEWNIPHHHRVTTFMPVDTLLDERPDGAKTLWMGETERRHRMKWVLGLTIHPDRSWIEVTVRLFNRTPLTHSFLYFTNAAVHVNEHYQVIFPPRTQYGTQHAKSEFIEWPLAHQAYADADYTAGVDVSWWKNHPNPLSIFAWPPPAADETDDFFGGYDHGRRAGVIHVGDHHTEPGKKFFTFANGPASSGRLAVAPGAQDESLFVHGAEAEQAEGQRGGGGR